MNGAAVKAYSLAKDGNTKLSAHFRVREFRCYDGTDTIFVSPALVEVLEKIRVHFNKPVNINSGYRTEVWNKKKGGSTYSQHKYGTAADITVGNKTTGVEAPKAVAAFVETVLKNTGGIGIYDSFVHVDVRKVKIRWNG